MPRRHYQFFGYIPIRQIQQFLQGIIMRHDTPGLGDLTELPVQIFHRSGRLTK
jgi:hypothetical protein